MVNKKCLQKLKFFSQRNKFFNDILFFSGSKKNSMGEMINVSEIFLLICSYFFENFNCSRKGIRGAMLRLWS
uniref:Uncharacterized protein n=1 Tax=Ascaris lumbricoides TaxID=6252 RepID=A0A0M3IVH0_ASCLU